MIYQNLIKFEEKFNNNQILLSNRCLNQIIQRFTFYVIKDINNLDQENQKVIEQKNESQIIIIDQLKEPYDQYLVIIFDNSIITISKSDTIFLINLLNNHQESALFTTSDKIESILPTEFKSNLYKYNKSTQIEYKTTIDHFSENFQIDFPNEKVITDIWRLICPTFSSYFINKSYNKLQKERFSLFNKENKEINLKTNEYITLQIIGQSSSSMIQLIYHLKEEKLFALKKFFDVFDTKLFMREYCNYKKIRHTNIPMFYGKTTIDKAQCLIIEYIRGSTLTKINEIELTETDKIKIIFQLMLIIEYLQNKKFIYRDLKPNNLIIDKNKNLFLIDFDRMIDYNEFEANEFITLNFNNDFMAPEIQDGSIKEYSYEEDIYSIGLLIYFIIQQEFPIFGRKDKSNKDNYSFDKFPQHFKKMKKFAKNAAKMILKIVQKLQN